MLLYLVFTCLIALATYLAFLQYQKRASSARTHHVSVQFKRSASVSSSPRQNEARSPIANSTGQRWRETSPKNTTPNDGGLYARNRNPTRSAGVNYISPSSMYGYMPKSNILSDRIKAKQPKKDFTIKLSPFPQMTRNNLKSPNLTFTSPRSEQSNNTLPLNQSSFVSNGSIPQMNDRPLPASSSVTSPPLTTTIVPRASTKRPILPDESSEDEFLLKKSKHLLDTFDVDDSEMSDQTDLEEVVVPNNKKSLKRSSLAFEGDTQVNSPVKRVKNNEILSSYSSTSVSQSRQLLNKRKYSPDESSTSGRVKKRTYIEELELLASEMSPYYRNIYSPQPESPTTIPKSIAAVSPSEVQSTLGPERVTNITPQTNTENQVDEQQETIEVVELGDESDVDSSSDSHKEVEAEPEPEVLQEEAEQSTVPSLSTHVFSIKDHEYDKKKSKSRLDRLLAATAEAFDSEEAPTTTAAAPSSNGDLNFSSSKSAFGNSGDDTQPAADSSSTPQTKQQPDKESQVDKQAETTKVPESLGNGESQKGITALPQLPKETEPAATSIAPPQQPTAPVSTTAAAAPIAFGIASAVTTTTAIASNSLSAPTPSFNSNMFALPTSKPSNTFQDLTPTTSNGLNFKPAVTFDFKAAAVPVANSTAAPTASSSSSNGGLNFSLSKSAFSGGFNFGLPQTSGSSSSSGVDFAKPQQQQQPTAPVSTTAAAAPIAFGTASAVTTTTAIASNSLSAPTPSFNSNMFALPPSKPSNTFQDLTPTTSNGLNFKPAVTFDFKAATASVSQSPAAPTASSSSSNGGFNFSLSKSAFSGGFNFGLPQTSGSSSSGVFDFAKPQQQQQPTAPVSTTAAAAPIAFGTASAVTTTAIASNSFSAPTPSFNSNMFALPPSKPSNTFQDLTSATPSNGLNFKPAVTFDFKAATASVSQSPAAPTASSSSSNGGFNFSLSKSAFSGGFNFGLPQTSGSSSSGVFDFAKPQQQQQPTVPSLSTAATPFTFGGAAPAAVATSSASSAPTPFSFNTPAKSTFTFGASATTPAAMFQFNGK